MDLDPRELPHHLYSACLEVHRRLGPGLPTAVYGDCLARELRMRELFFKRNAALPIRYRGACLRGSVKTDFLIEKSLLLNIRSPERTLVDERDQLQNYLRLARLKFGLLVDFEVADLRMGFIRIVLDLITGDMEQTH